VSENDHNETLQFVFVSILTVHIYDVVSFYFTHHNILLLCLLYYGQYNIIFICQTLYIVYKNYASFQRWVYDSFYACLCVVRILRVLSHKIKWNLVFKIFCHFTSNSITQFKVTAKFFKRVFINILTFLQLFVTYVTSEIQLN